MSTPEYDFPIPVEKFILESETELDEEKVEAAVEELENRIAWLEEWAQEAEEAFAELLSMLPDKKEEVKAEEPKVEEVKAEEPKVEKIEKTEEVKTEEPIAIPIREAEAMEKRWFDRWK